LTLNPQTQSSRRTAGHGEVDRIYGVLKKWLIECELSPGDVLSEVDLARRCDTSRTPIREACNRLAQDGWIVRIPHKGYLVAPVSIHDVLQLYDYRKILECFAAERAAQIATPEDLESLAQIISVEKPDADVSAVVAENDHFHLSIAGIAGNKCVYDQLALTLEYVHRLDCISAQRSQSWISNGEILQALQTRKPQEARAAMANHIDYARDRMLHLLANDAWAVPAKRGN
jgi:DNA-binding GntR family transcriptional regulator